LCALLRVWLGVERIQENKKEIPVRHTCVFLLPIERYEERARALAKLSKMCKKMPLFEERVDWSGRRVEGPCCNQAEAVSYPPCFV
jgi:hypothetical protein